jgi:hypothetical protein
MKKEYKATAQQETERQRTLRAVGQYTPPFEVQERRIAVSGERIL